jgi:hypothetical protein
MYHTTNGPVESIWQCWQCFAPKERRHRLSFERSQARRLHPESNNMMTSSQERVLESLGSPKRVFLWERITSRH